jgi:hypothetical protein
MNIAINIEIFLFWCVRSERNSDVSSKVGPTKERLTYFTIPGNILQ